MASYQEPNWGAIVQIRFDRASRDDIKLLFLIESVED